FFYLRKEEMHYDKKTDVDKHTRCTECRPRNDSDHPARSDTGGAGTATYKCARGGTYRPVGRAAGICIIDDPYTDGDRHAVCISREHGGCTSCMADVQAVQKAALCGTW